VTVRNAGTVDIGPVTFALSGPYAGDFLVERDTCASGVTVDGSCLVYVVYKPMAGGPTSDRRATITASAANASAAGTLVGYIQQQPTLFSPVPTSSVVGGVQPVGGGQAGWLLDPAGGVPAENQSQRWLR